MTRRLLALFAPSLLAAQAHWSDVSTLPVKRIPRIPRPRNGECPVCGTMAKPLRVVAMEWDEVRMVVCEYCNNIFRQWAEGKEPKR